MRITNNQMIIGGVLVAALGYWMYNRYRSRKAIEQVKEDELSAIPSSPTPVIPKMYIKAGTNIPAGALSFVDDKQKMF